MAQTTGRVPIPEMRRTDTARFGGITRFAGRRQGYAGGFTNAPTMRFGQESYTDDPSVGSGTRTRTRTRSAASQDPVARLASVRKSISSAGERYWGKGGPPPSSPRRRSRYKQFNPTGRSYGSDNPKRLSYRRFTSKWLSQPGKGLLQPNPYYMGGSGDFDYASATRMGMGQMPSTMGMMKTTFPRYNT